MRINHTGGARPTTLLTPMTSAGLEAFSVALADNWPTSNFYVVVERGTLNEEKVLVASRDGVSFTPSMRGADSTNPVQHQVGASVEHVFTAVEADDANLHIESQDGVHGLVPGDRVAGRAYVTGVTSPLSDRVTANEGQIVVLTNAVNTNATDIADRYTKAEVDQAIEAKTATYGDLLT